MFADAIAAMASATVGCASTPPAARVDREPHATAQSEAAVDRPALQMAVDEPGVEAVAGADRVDRLRAQGGGAHDGLAVERDGALRAALHYRPRPQRSVRRTARAGRAEGTLGIAAPAAPAPRLAATASASSWFGK